MSAMPRGFKMLLTRAETVSLGMAKPMPAEAPLGEKIAVFMPMTCWKKRFLEMQRLQKGQKLKVVGPSLAKPTVHKLPLPTNPEEQKAFPMEWWQSCKVWNTWKCRKQTHIQNATPATHSHDRSTKPVVTMWGYPSSATNQGWVGWAKHKGGGTWMGRWAKMEPKSGSRTHPPMCSVMVSLHHVMVPRNLLCTNSPSQPTLRSKRLFRWNGGKVVKFETLESAGNKPTYKTQHLPRTASYFQVSTDFRHFFRAGLTVSPS